MIEEVKTKVYKFNDVKIYYCKGKTTLPNDYVFNFINSSITSKIESFLINSQLSEKYFIKIQSKKQI